jgi:D-psicose/D-tagatose/L-ribulose 3-epimerase
MKLGVNTFIWSAEFDENAVPMDRIREAGFDGIEVAIFDPLAFDAKALRSALDRYGLESTVVAVIPKGLSIGDSDGAVRAKTQEFLRSTISAAAEAGVRTVAGPLFMPVGFLPGRRRTEDEWRYAVEAYQALGETLAEHRVTLAIEPLNRFETYFLNTAADAARLAHEVNHPNIGILFDTFHANIEEKDIGEAIGIVTPWLRHVHTCENDRGTPGSGHVDWVGVFSALRKAGYDGWLTIESFGFALPMLSAAAAIWRDIEPSPDRIAFDGVRFLRQNLQAWAETAS